MRECRRGVDWKSSVAKWVHNGEANVCRLHNSLADGTYRIGRPITFKISDPKPRQVHAMRFADRVVQRSLCNNGLYRMLTKSFIYDNCACQVGKGTGFALERLKAHLQKHFRETGGNGGYCVCLDIKQYFNSTSHRVLKEKLEKTVPDKDFRARVVEVIDCFKDERPAEEVMTDPFGERGVGIGSQICQLLQLMYLDELDHYAKETLRIRHYVRYMDDIVFIAQTREDAESLWTSIEENLSRIGLTLNEKSRICPIRNGIVFLKTHLRLTDTGAILHKCVRKTVSREIRKSNKLLSLFSEGKTTAEELI